MDRKKNNAIQSDLIKIRNEKIKKQTLWVSFDRKYTERISSKKYNTIEEKDIVALLIGETNDFISISFKKNGGVYKYKKSTLSNYKELKRLPKRLYKE